MKKIILTAIAVAAAGVMSSCVNMDLMPANEMTSDMFKEDPAAIEYSTIGVYQWFSVRRTNPTMTNTTSTTRTRYIRNWFQMSEFRGDNAIIAGRTTDPFMWSYDYADTPDAETNRYMWYVSYSMLTVLNSNIGMGEEGLSDRADHVLGENYFLRAAVYLNMCDLYARPYTHGADNLAVILRTEEPYEGELKRATIGEVYAQIEKDLLKACELMGKGYRRETDAGFAWLGSAQGLLSRLYLNMERNQDVVDIVNEMLGGKDAASVLDPDYATYYTRAFDSPETLWCIHVQASESMGSSGIASMYLKDGTGWGEIYPSDPFFKLITRYAEDDIRWTAFHTYAPIPATATPYYNGEIMQWMASWSRDVSTPGYPTRDNNFRYLAEDAGGKYIIFATDMDSATADTKEDFFTNTSTKIYIKERIVNTYPEYYFTYDGKDVEVILTEATDNRYGYRKIYNKKFSYQDGDPMLSSPPMIRWGEVLLNRAEAYAKLGNTAAALADVNTIRERSGLSGDQLMTETNMGPRGYATALDVVLDERRLELAYEGFRYKDIFRNKRAMDRQFSGSHMWEVIDWQDPRIPHQISGDELIRSAGVLPNPGKIGIEDFQ
jgi:hypothetical protein